MPILYALNFSSHDSLYNFIFPKFNYSKTQNNKINLGHPPSSLSKRKKMFYFYINNKFVSEISFLEFLKHFLSISMVG